MSVNNKNVNPWNFAKFKVYFWLLDKVKDAPELVNW